MTTLNNIKEHLRLAILAWEKIPEIQRKMIEEADAQNYHKAAELKKEKDEAVLLLPKLSDLKQWESILDDYIKPKPQPIEIDPNEANQTTEAEKRTEA